MPKCKEANSGGRDHVPGQMEEDRRISKELHSDEQSAVRKNPLATEGFHP